MTRRHRHARRRDSQRHYSESPNPTRFYRSRSDNVIAGVCGGLANRFGWDPLVVRLIALALFFFAFGPLMIVAYLVVWLLTPLRPKGFDRAADPEEEAFWRDVSDRPKATFGTLRYTFMDLESRLQRLERDVTSDEWRLRREFRDLEGH